MSLPSADCRQVCLGYGSVGACLIESHICMLGSNSLETPHWFLQILTYTQAAEAFVLAFPHRCDALAMANILADQVRLGTTEAVGLGMGFLHIQGSDKARSVQHTAHRPNTTRG